MRKVQIHFGLYPFTCTVKQCMKVDGYEADVYIHNPNRNVQSYGFCFLTCEHIRDVHCSIELVNTRRDCF